MELPVIFWKSARKHRIGKARARHVIDMSNSTRVLVEGDATPRIRWVGPDDRGVLLEVIALETPEAIVVIHVMPQYPGRKLS